MKGKKLYLFIAVIFVFNLFADKYVRWNLAGYLPDAPKSIVVMSDEKSTGLKWKIIDINQNSEVLSGVIGNSVCGRNIHTPFPYNYVIDISSLSKEGKYRFLLDGVNDSVIISVDKNVCSKIAESNLRFIRVMRAGSKDVLDRKPAHFGDSSCYVYRRQGTENTDPWEEDKNGKKVNMLGGWYEGFAYTKVTHIQGLITYNLLRAYEENPDIFVKKYSKSEYVDILDEAKWGLDYLVKTMPDDNEFIISVGGFKDNERGTLLPHEDDRDGKREAFSIFSVPQMANVSAALALGSNIFGKLGKKELADKYKNSAIKIFNAAIKKANENVAWLEQDYDLFKDDSGNDNMLLAAAELYRLTGNSKYVPLIKKYALRAKAAGWVSYANLNMFAHLRAMDVFPQSKKFFLEDMKDFFTNSASKNNLWHIPLEYSFQSVYANIQISNAALYYQELTNDKKFSKLPPDMFDYILGKNNWGISFVALPWVKNSAKNIYSQIYLLQKRLFPEGAVVIGPLDAESHDEESKWCYFDPKMMPEYKFNTEELRFFNHSDDYMCTEVNTFGVADCVLFMSLFSKAYGK